MKNERGVTLIELLATMVILTIISLFAFNIIVSSQKQQAIQKEDSKNLYDITYSLKVLTKDFRMSTSFDSSTNTFYKDEGKTKIATYSFDSSKKQITRDTYKQNGTKESTTIISEKTTHFSLTKSADEKSITVDISNSSDQTIKNTLYYRE